MENQEKGIRTLIPPKETYNFSHGIHRYKLHDDTLVTAVSAQTWSEYIKYLSQITDKDRLVVSPELMTFTGQPLAEVNSARQTIEKRIEEIKEMSKKRKQVLFLLGTPTFPAKGKPRNSILYIQNGKIIGSTNKRSGVTPAERDYFDLPAEEPAALIPGTNIGVLICADLSTASLYMQPNLNDRTLKMAGRENLIGSKPTFLHPNAKSLLLPSCWGIGANKSFLKHTSPDEYYRHQLRTTATHVFNRSQLEEIVVIDRIPLVGEELKPLTSTKPYNAFLQREDGLPSDGYVWS